MYNREFWSVVGKALAAAAIGIGIGWLITPARADDALNVQVLNNTVQINDNCSGTLIYSDRDKESGKVETLILTAKHCVTNEDQDFKIHFPKYQNNRVVKQDTYIGKVKGKSYKYDLSLLSLKDTETYFKSVSKIAPDNIPLSLGDRVLVAGYPLGYNLTVTDGMFGGYQSIDYPKSGAEYFRSTPDIAPGSSGGALYGITKEGKYELIGVTTAGFRGFTFMNLFTPVDQINEYLKVAVPKLYTTEKND